jgi:conjugal transfer/type IV secretion protein DotA/TraY
MSSGSLFQADRPAQDLGLSMLGQLTTGPAKLVESLQPLRDVIQKMLGIYSSAVLVIAGFVVLYYFILTIVDAAQTGKVFRRINPVWGPLRLVIAIGLLVPLPMAGAAGLNSGQLIVVQIAQWGSGLASKLWGIAMIDSKTLRPMISVPAPVPAMALVRALVLRDACVSFTTQVALQMKAQADRAARAAIESGGSDAVIKPPPLSLERVTEQPIVTNADGSQTRPYGWADRPYFCGAVTIFPASEEKDEPMFLAIKQGHLDGLRRIETRTIQYAADYLALVSGQGVENANSPLPIAERYQEILGAAAGRTFLAALDKQVDSTRRQLANMGWAGAPAYLDTILRLNVRIISMNASLPQVDLPELLMSPPPKPADPNKPTPEYKVYELLLKVDRSWGETARLPPMSAAGLGGLSTLLSQAVAVSREVSGPGATGHQLRAARDLLQINDYDWERFGNSNPLIGLAELGAYLTGKAAELLAGAGILGNVGPVTGPTVALISVLGILAFLVSTALLLILPLIPLIRFLLGIAVWLVEVFEALIAIPLVALAHLRADENGLAGQSAVLCYVIILKVALRPVLMVFGLLGGLVILMLMLAALNLLLAGTMPGVIDSGQISSLWFVLVSAAYAVLVLGVANAAFKLIDWLPERTLTWLQGVMLPGRPGGAEIVDAKG